MQTQDFSAVAGEDYLHTSGVAVIPAGASQANVQVSVINDSLGELNEAMLLRLGNPSANARLGVVQEVGQIDDDEPIVTIDGASVAEGDTGTASLIFPVTLSSTTANDVTVQFTTAPMAPPPRGPITFQALERCAFPRVLPLAASWSASTAIP